MTDLQSKLLEMMTWLHNFIISHDLIYYAFGGTMLGATRHHGFIPWDDDIDIVMPRNDYKKLCELLKNKVEHYIVEDANSLNDDYLYTYAKFYDTNTSMTEVSRINVKRGVFIDIFPIDGLGNTKSEALKYYKKIDKKNMFLATRVCAYRKERKWYKNVAIFLCRLIPSFIVNNKKLCIKIDKLNQKRAFDDYHYFGLNMSTYRDRDIHNKEILGKPTLYKFETIEIYGVENADKYLSETYGDWKKLPAEDKRHSAHDFINLDLNKPYME